MNTKAMFSVECVEGIVELALARAERDDPKMLALIAYKSRSSESDPLAQEALAKRFAYVGQIFALLAWF